MKALIFFLFVFMSMSIFSQKKIRLFDEEQQMKEELLRHFPLGTDTSDVVSEMKKNKFESYTFIQEDLWKEGQKLYDKIDYLSFRRSKSTSLWISTTWIIRMRFDSEGTITSIIVEIGYTGP